MSHIVTVTEDKRRDSQVANEAKTIGTHVDAFVANPSASPLAAVGIGLLAGYLLARLMGR